MYNHILIATDGSELAEKSRGERPRPGQSA